MQQLMPISFFVSQVSSVAEMVEPILTIFSNYLLLFNYCSILKNSINICYRSKQMHACLLFIFSAALRF